MERVIVAPEASGLAQMLADLIRGNLATHPDRVSLLEQMRGHVNVTATDAEVTAGLVFTGGEVTVGSPVPRPEIAIACDSETLLELASVPLVGGSPNVATPQGRALAMKMLNRSLRVKGMVRHAALLNKLQRLLSVA